MAWQSARDSKGNSYRWFQPERLMSCGVACVMMVANLTKSKQLGESTVRRWFGEAEGAVNMDSTGVRDFTNTGSTQSPIIGVLSRGLGISATMSPPTGAVRHLMQCRPEKPGILHITWPGEGAHWVVVARFNWVRTRTAGS